MSFVPPPPPRRPQNGATTSPLDFLTPANSGGGLSYASARTTSFLRSFLIVGSIAGLVDICLSAYWLNQFVPAGMASEIELQTVALLFGTGAVVVSLLLLGRRDHTSNFTVFDTADARFCRNVGMAGIALLVPVAIELITMGVPLLLAGIAAVLMILLVAALPVLFILAIFGGLIAFVGRLIARPFRHF